MTLQDRTAHNVTLSTNNVLAKMRKGEIAFGCQFNSPVVGAGGATGDCGVRLRHL